MNTQLTSRSICAVAFGGWAALASALSLGPVTGTTVIGRPLELVAPIQFDDVEAGGSGCVTAEVMYGDRIVDRSRVDVDVNADGARQLSYARISSALAVDEPFVTVVLRAGCGRPSTRRYVLLADAPRQEPVVLFAASALGAATPVQLSAVVPGGPVRERAVPPLRASRFASAGPRPERAPVPLRRVAQRDVAQPAGRLQLAVWDPSSEQLPWLRASTELKTSPTADAARRAAASALWRALNAQPQDLLRTAERLRGLEAEMGTLRTLSARHRAEIASARESLQGAQAQRHTSVLVVTLLALLAGSAAAFFWHRARRPARASARDSWYGPIDPWEQSGIAPAECPPPAPAPIPPRAETVMFKAAPVEAIPQPAAVQPLPVEAGAPELEPFAFSLADPEPPGATLPARPAEEPGLRVDGLHGAHQQAEFFASLGQIDEAVAVLKTYIDDCSEPPALPFLELMRIYHGTGTQEEYEDLRRTFRQVFRLDVPAFADYKDDPRELDLYLRQVMRIGAAWPSQGSLDVIEELLFKRPASPGDLLSLHAYRDLLWLYSLGQELEYTHSSPAGLQLRGDSELSNDHFILPWAVDEEPTELSLARLDTIDVAPELSGFGVDIDLTSYRGKNHPAIPMAQQPSLEPASPQTAATELESNFDAFDKATGSESRRHDR